MLHHAKTSQEKLNHSMGLDSLYACIQSAIPVFPCVPGDPGTASQVRFRPV
jgi:hypothetical protein